MCETDLLLMGDELQDFFTHCPFDTIDKSAYTPHTTSGALTEKLSSSMLSLRGQNRNTFLLWSNVSSYWFGMLLLGN